MVSRTCLEPAHPRDDALDAHPEAAVRHRTIATEVEVPLEGFLRQLMLLVPLLEQFEGPRAARRRR
jgi:hypothetical protein